MFRFYAPLIICATLFCQCAANESEFSSSAWKSSLHHSEDSYTNRSEEFSKFLRDYDLIGMPQNQLATLLGEADYSSGYTIKVGPDSMSFLEVQYKNKKVDRWRVCGFPRGRNNPWVSTNMLYTSNGLVAKPNKNEGKASN
jgi:hypothetical protein